MKKFVAGIMIIVFLFLVIGCGDTKVINETKYDTYGLINKEDKCNPKIEYRLITGNFVWSIILFETIIAPIYFLGFSMYEPVGIKDKTRQKGVI